MRIRFTADRPLLPGPRSRVECRAFEYVPLTGEQADHAAVVLSSERAPNLPGRLKTPTTTADAQVFARIRDDIRTRRSYLRPQCSISWSGRQDLNLRPPAPQLLSLTPEIPLIHKEFRGLTHLPKSAHALYVDQ